MANPTTFTIRTFRPFEPTEVSGLVGWWDASTLEGADGSSVSALLDSSGNEAHMYQSTSARQPTLQTNELNNRNVLRFDGVDDFLNLTAPLDVQPTTVTTYDANAWSPNGEYLAHANANTSPRIFIYKKTGNVFNKLPDPVTLPTGNVNGLAWSNDNQFLAVAHTTTPFITIYQRSGDTFTKLANPATLPTGTGANCSFSKDGSFLAVSHATTPFITIYQISGSTFTKLTNPASLPTGTGGGISFSPDNNYLTVGFLTSPFVHTYSISGTTFTKLTNPTTLPTSALNSLNWLNSTTCAVGQDASNTILIYQYDGSSKFELLTSFNVTGATGINSLRYSNSKNYLAVAHNSTNYFTVYSISGTTYTAINNPASLPLGVGRGVAWGLNDTNLVVSHTNSPFIQAYTFDGTTLINLTKLNIFRNVGGASVFSVVKYTLSGTEQISFFSSVGTSTDTRFGLSRNPTFKLVQNVRALDSDTNPQNLSTQSIDGFSYYIHSAYSNFNLREHRQYINNILDGSKNGITTAGNTSNTDSRSILIGRLATGLSYLNGDIAEVIIFDRILTTQELKNVHYYLAQKYNISVPL